MAAPECFADADALADRIVAQVGRTILLVLPPGLGKAVHVANALFARARQDASIDLTIFTGLTLEPPAARSELERRFTGPLNERLFAGWPELSYVRALRENALPPNVTVNDFFLLAGRWLGNAHMQQNYVSANFTHLVRLLEQVRPNVLAQLVASRGDGAKRRLSLSSNPDATLDVLPLLRARRAAGEKIALVAQVNPALPFFGGEAELPASGFDYLLEDERCNFPLFPVPKQPVSDADYAAGLHAAGQVRDGGTLQIGIGSMADAISHALILRHGEPELFAATLGELGNGPPAEAGPFRKGLFACSEMLADSFLDLIDAGVVKRKARDGALVHGGFFIGPEDFYQRLREMSDEERGLISMRAISDINELYGDEARKRAERLDARFINSAMMATLLGAAVSDSLEDGRVVSGVGGQYNFVAQAFALEGARSLIALNATRGRGKGLKSNVLWSYGHVTIPRHLRDMVITEYGVADLRGRSDRDCVAAMLGIADSRFQERLLDAARRAGKIEAGYRIPEAQRRNLPEQVAAALEPARQRGFFPPFPFGTDLTGTEQYLLPALRELKAASGSRMALLRLLASGLLAQPDAAQREALQRMDLAGVSGARERVYRALLLGALRNQARDAAFVG